MSQEAIDQAGNDFTTVSHQLAKAVAARDLAMIDLDRTTIRAPAQGWITNLNVHAGEFITRGTVSVALVKRNSFYLLAYMEETKLERVASGVPGGNHAVGQQPYSLWYGGQRFRRGDQRQQRGGP